MVTRTVNGSSSLEIAQSNQMNNSRTKKILSLALQSQRVSKDESDSQQSKNIQQEFCNAVNDSSFQAISNVNMIREESNIMILNVTDPQLLDLLSPKLVDNSDLLQNIVKNDIIISTTIPNIPVETTAIEAIDDIILPEQEEISANNKPNLDVSNNADICMVSVESERQQSEFNEINLYYNGIEQWLISDDNEIEKRVTKDDSESGEQMTRYDNENEKRMITDDNEIEKRVTKDDNESEEQMIRDDNENEERMITDENEIEKRVPKDDNESEEQMTRDDNENEERMTKDVHLSVYEKRKHAMLDRVSGRSYLGYKRLEKKVFYDVQKPERKIKNRCNHTVKSKTTDRSFLCASISDEQRHKIFNNFWNDFKSWKEKKAYVKGLVSSRIIKRRRKNVSMKRLKLEGHDIHFHNENGKKMRVCRTFFLNTLCLGEDTYKRWVKNKDLMYDSSDNNEEHISINTGISNSEANDTFMLDNDQSTDSDTSLESVNSNENRNHLLKKKNHKARKNLFNIRRKLLEAKKQKLIQQNQNKSAQNTEVLKWLDLLPKVPSHYCRSTSKKIYVESSFRSRLHMYKVYREWCSDSNLKSAGRKYFDSVLKEKNIGIHKPRKDQCDTYSSFKVGNIPETTYNAHIKKKNAARDAKAAAKASANQEKLVITMDLQSVLLSPKTLDSALYYKQKLQIHNFTIFQLNDKDVYLYVWHEANGGVSANEFTSCIIDYLSNISDKYKEVVLISDGCNYQNRNKTLASSLSDFAKRKHITIEQLFLEKGHTMMEADNVHSVLEHLFKPPIYSPSDYIARMRLARPSQPYKIKVLGFEFFLNYDDIPTNLVSIRPGKKAGDPTVTDLRQLKYVPTGNIEFKIDINSDWQEIPHRRKAGNSTPKKLYLAQLPITESKYRHLQELKELIDKDHHPFYDSLTFKADKK